MHVWLENKGVCILDFMLALSAVGQAVSIVKGVRDIDKDLSQAELKAAMAEIYDKLSDLKMALTDAREEIREKDDTIKTLKASRHRLDALIEIQGFHYDVVEGKPLGFPYCPRCIAREGYFHKIYAPNHLHGPRLCPECKTDYGDAARHFK